jgi:predicted secreted protein
MLAMLRATPWLAFATALVVMSAHAVTVRLNQNDGSRIQVALHPGDLLRIDLQAEPTSGKTWSARGHAPDQLTELGSTQRVFGGIMGNEGTSSFAWRAIKDGEGEITLIYGTANARAMNPEKTVTIQLTVAGEPLGPEEAHPPAVSQLKRETTYERKAPCGDCSGILERLALYRGPDETPFVLWRTYKDAPGGGTLTSVMTGSWTTAKGSADPTATIYTLTDSTEASSYRLTDDRLIPLDAQQIPIPSPPGMDTSFHRIETP